MQSNFYSPTSPINYSNYSSNKYLSNYDFGGGSN